ncbi:helix-turn-helix domain-containing protein [Streptomyces daliensis]|uniref:Helix-turn-helix domain-containing protein n=1 Tax=Streptomyces daliensis TaxID=299421 RepID=A0A8T4ILW7_9ACTN|nr:helix-turn-helix domain-containing protein [Streptomyces daliensis]
MPAGGRPTVRSRRLGATLRRFREAAKIDQLQAAEYIAGSKAKVSRIEAGQVSARPGDVRLMLELYGIEDRKVHQHLEQLARDSNKRGWWFEYSVPDSFGDYVALEEDATHIRSWEPLLIPGLLQTADYTRCLVNDNPSVTDPGTADQVVKVRQERRQKVETLGTRFAVVIGESALVTPMPSSAVHRGQLASLLQSAQESHVTLQVLPTTEWSATRCSPSFIMLSFDGEWSPTAVGQDTRGNIAVAEDPETITQYAHAFELLQATALTPAQSLDFLRRAMDDVTEEHS